MNAIATLIFLFFSGYHLSVTVADDAGPGRHSIPARRDHHAMSWTDKELGMDRPITRRDFMNGAAMAIAAAATPHSRLFGQAVPGPQDRPGYDPPAAHGLRGSHAGAFEVAHQLRDGTFWANAGQPESTGESYDLVVVGGRHQRPVLRPLLPWSRGKDRTRAHPREPRRLRRSRQTK